MSASYEYYVATYHGEILTSQDFPKFVTRADSYLDYITQGRYTDSSLTTDVQNKVKMAECAIADQCYKIENANIRTASSQGEIASESVGSHSRSYRSGYDTSKEAEAEIFNIARRYLGFTGLLFRGMLCTRHTWSHLSTSHRTRI